MKRNRAPIKVKYATTTTKFSFGEIKKKEKVFDVGNLKTKTIFLRLFNQRDISAPVKKKKNIKNQI